MATLKVVIAFVVGVIFGILGYHVWQEHFSTPTKRERVRQWLAQCLNFLWEFGMQRILHALAAKATGRVLARLGA